jgi:nicotinamide phosphoribosyltransferase
MKEYLIKQWNDHFFSEDLDVILKRWKRRTTNSLGPNSVNLDLMAGLWGLGYLPLEIRALPEGSQVPIGMPPLIWWNTLDDHFWLTNNIETIMSTTIWQPCTSATAARELYKEFVRGSMKTIGNMDFVPFQGHDFSMRGMSSLETAALSGAAHLLYFNGSDSVPAIDFLEEYYNADSDKELIGVSVPATEHSVMCMGGKEGEIETFKRLLSIYPSGYLSVVSDTWDFWQVLTVFLPQLKEQIMARDGKLVIRPDSGDPADIICGEPIRMVDKTTGYIFSHKTGRVISEVISKGAIEILWDIFGGTIVNGYKVLDPHIGLIYGDSINIDRAREINARLEAKGFATTNWVAGVGSYTYQFNTRDTHGFAVKATYGEVVTEGVGPAGEVAWRCLDKREIYKDPKTDDGTKKSAKGLIALFGGDSETGSYRMKDQASWDEVKNCSYVPVFRDSNLLVDQSYSEISKRAKSCIIH